MAARARDELPTGESGAPALNVSAIRSDLAVTRLGGEIHYYYDLDSTNAAARRLAENGAREGAVVIAERQTQGRGRLGRRWESPPYVNLYLSLILKPTLPPVHAPQITLMAAVAVAETVAAFIAEPPAIKWPNDILIGGKKVSGILTELSWESNRVAYAVLGIGVNLNYRAAAMPDEVRRRATSLLETTGENVSREAFARRLIHNLDRCYGILEASGFEAIRPLWESRFALMGRRVRVQMTDEALQGRARGIDRDGALLVEQENGALRRIIAADVTPLED